MVEVKFNLMKRDFIWIGLIVVLVGVGFVFAYGGSSPSVMGHSAGEVESENAESICGDNLFLDGDGQCRTAAQIVADGGGSGGSVSVSVYKCPFGTTSGYGAAGGAWMYMGCQGQISSSSTCKNLVYPGAADIRSCTYLGKIMVA